MAARPLVALMICLLPTAAAAQQAFTLDIPNIMRGPETVGREPSSIRWTPDGEWIHFSWLPPGTDWRESNRPYRVRAIAGAEPESLSRALADSLAPMLADGVRSRSGEWKIVGTGGDLWRVGLPSGKVVRLTSTRASEQPLSLSRDESTLFYRDGNNVIALTLSTGVVKQLTDIRPGTKPDTARRTPAQRSALERDQIELLEAIRDQVRRDSIRTAEREEREAGVLPVTWLGREARLRTLSPSPSGNHALIIASTSATPAPKNTMVPDFVTKSGYTEELDTRTKVGDAQGKDRVGLLTIATGEVEWLRPLPGDSTDQYGGIASWGWNDDGSAVLLRAESSDHERRTIARVDTTGALAVIDSLTDSAWVGGPCGYCGGWLPGNDAVWFVNEADGYAHLYTMGRDGDNRRQLTSGTFEVLQATLSEDRSRFEMHTSEGSPYQRHFWVMDLDGDNRTRLTTTIGGHSATPSPDGARLALVHSASNQPPELFIQDAREGAEAVRLTTSPLPEWAAFDWISPEIVEIPASDGIGVPARIYRPEQMGVKPNGAAVLFVHGAGYLHNVHDYWSSYYREYQFHHLLAARGFVVLDVDYRGSAGYGRDWRTAIFRHMGGRDLEDFVDASKWLTSTMGIPGDRIGLYGGSYGGFITLMALFTRPEYFGAGAALRSVTDWAHYNHGYTARILNEPQGDSTAYRQSSPIFFAEGLEDPLLIAHGMVDTNVHFQDVVRLVQRLIELGKEHWELAVYPVENHGFERPDSWTDEYRRILELFERWLPAEPAR